MRDALRKLGGLWCRLSTLGWASPVRLFSLCVKKKATAREKKKKKRDARSHEASRRSNYTYRNVLNLFTYIFFTGGRSVALERLSNIHTHTAIFVRDLLDGVAFSSSFLQPFALYLVAVAQVLFQTSLQCDALASCSVCGSKRQTAAGGVKADAYCPQLRTRASQAGGRPRVEKNDDVQAVKGREGNYANCCYTHAHAKWGEKDTH